MMSFSKKFTGIRRKIFYFSYDGKGIESIENLGKLKPFEDKFFRKIKEKYKGFPAPPKMKRLNLKK